MRIALKSITGEGIEFSRIIKPTDLGLEHDLIDCRSSLALHALIHRADEAVVARVNVKGKYGFSCARCLSEVEQERSNDFDIYFEVDHDTQYVDLGEDVRQEMVVALSNIVLCSEDCKGLCMGCGQNLNIEKCKCKKT